MTLSKQTTYQVEIQDVEYLRHGDKPFLARVFEPQGDGPFPVMIELHGGAWVNGTRENGDVGNQAIASNGIVVVALDFRVPPEASYPASFQDIHYGIRWAKAHAAEWNGNGGKIGAMGTSSGAHQAMLLGMRPSDARYSALSLTNGASDVDGSLGCVIMVSPVIDPLGRYHYAQGIREDVKPPESVGERTVRMHDMYWVTEEAMAEAAPARALARGEKAELPPTLCLVREYEAAHPRPDLLEFVSQYQNAGGQIDLTVFQGEGEGVLRDPSTDVAQQALEQMTAFINQHLG